MFHIQIFIILLLFLKEEGLILMSKIIYYLFTLVGYANPQFLLPFQRFNRKYDLAKSLNCSKVRDFCL
jgi:hypothetical protein